MNTSKLVVAASCVAALFLISGCSQESGFRNIVGAADPKLANEPVPVTLVQANTRFGVKLCRNILAQEAGRNVFVSPASVSIALAMTYNGADGTTREAMARTLELRDMTLDEVNQANLILLSNLAYADSKVKLAIANSLWSKETMPFYPDFIERNRRYYGAEVTSLDFGDPTAPDIINGWVNRNTNGKIPEIIENIPPEAILYLINAIYFKGTWTEEFDPAATRQSDFTLPSGTTNRVPMMHQSGTYPYLETPEFQAVSLGYGDSSRFSMYVFLPGQSSSLAAFHESLTEENWSAWMSRFGKAEGDIGLPRFEIAYEKTLNGILKAMGMEIAFDPNGADFGKMLPVSPMANAYISEVKHKMYVKVNEEGAEAAAATSVEIGYTSFSPPFTMIVDRPFFAAIRDNQSGTILFMGSITDPQP